MISKNSTYLQEYISLYPEKRETVTREELEDFILQKEKGGKQVDYLEMLNKVIDLAKQVGQFQKDNILKPDLVVSTKSTVTDLVTEIDEKSEEIIVGYLQKNFPEHSILTEESGDIGKLSDCIWIIDPLDGTTNYAQGLPIFTVSIALEVKGETVLGVVYNPITDELFTAIKGQGAYRNQSKMKVSNKSALNIAVLATGFPYDIAQNPINNLNYFNRLSTKTRAIRRFGSAAYDLALVADGRFDGYWEMALHAWDVGAGSLLVKEAGGKVLHFRNDRGISIIAGNDVMCGAIMNELNA